MTLFDLQPGFEEDLGPLKPAQRIECPRPEELTKEQENKNQGIDKTKNNVPDQNRDRDPNNQNNQMIPGQSLAMAYVPYQEFDDLFTSYSDALDNGSLFRNLVKTFSGSKVIRR
ncbi:MAG: spore coat associated protein CotJA [Eubacteriales bacterium]